MSFGTLLYSRRPLAASCALMAVMLGCGRSQAAPQAETKEEAEATQKVERYAEDVVAAVGGTALTKPAVSAAACTGQRGELGQDVFYVQGAFQLPVAAGKHRAALARARAFAEQRGFEVKRERTYADGATGELSVRNPADGYTFSLESTEPPTALALSVHSPCYGASSAGKRGTGLDAR